MKPFTSDNTQTIRVVSSCSSILNCRVNRLHYHCKKFIGSEFARIKLTFHLLFIKFCFARVTILMVKWSFFVNLQQRSSTSWLEETRSWRHVATIGRIVGVGDGRFHGNGQLQQPLLECGGHAACQHLHSFRRPPSVPCEFNSYWHAIRPDQDTRTKSKCHKRIRGVRLGGEVATNRSQIRLATAAMSCSNPGKFVHTRAPITKQCDSVTAVMLGDWGCNRMSSHTSQTFVVSPPTFSPPVNGRCAPS